MKILQINFYDLFSTGNIMLNIARVARERGHDVRTASKYMRMSVIRKSNNPHHFYIGNRVTNTIHRYFSWITDLQDCASIFPTLRLIYKIGRIKPDIIHLHDIVGWYLNIGVLFHYLKKKNISIVWTFHDCWAITGRCVYFDAANCSLWKTGCGNCPQKEYMPGTWFFDMSAWNYRRKKRLFTGIRNMTIVTPSIWLKELVSESFLQMYPTIVINNGIDLRLFKPTEGETYCRIKALNKHIVLGVAGTWSTRKGLNDFLYMSGKVPADYTIVLVGLAQEELPVDTRVVAISRTHNQVELAEIYTAATVFANPTIEDNFPTVNIEALACGTPIVTYRTGGSPESVDETTGVVVEQNDIEGMIQAIMQIANRGKNSYRTACLQKSANYDMSARFNDYVDLYEQIVDNRKA